MSKVCEITGKRAMFGNNVSFSIKQDEKKIQRQPFEEAFLYSRRRSLGYLKGFRQKALKTINKKGISAVLKEAKAQGVLK